MPIEPSDVADIYSHLNLIGNLRETPDGGYLRSGYSAEEDAAFELFRTLGKSHGFKERFDEIGNLVLEIPGTDPTFVETGSHLDTVPVGGNYDGAAGVVAGFLALKAIRRSNPQFARGLRLRIWRLEESSTFNAVCFGSRAAFGMCEVDALTRRFEDKTLEEAIRSRGYNPTVVRSRSKTISQSEVDSIVAHVELHIEQATVLETQGIDVGIVTGIRGVNRFRVTVQGSFDHSGGTPMGTQFRRDSNLAIAHALVAIDRIGNEALAAGRDLVQTVGVINSDPALNATLPEVYQNSTAKVSGFGYFTLDVRSLDGEFRQHHTEQLIQVIKETCSTFGVSCDIARLSSTLAIPTLDTKLRSAMELAAKANKISSMSLASGAYHDAAIVAQQHRSDGTPIPTAMLFIPCRGGKSHSPDEWTSYDAIAKGARVIAGALVAL